MKLVCAPKDYPFTEASDQLHAILYDHADRRIYGSAGASIKEQIARARLVPAPRSWDFLTLALSVAIADLAGHRSRSPDGWTREFDLEVAVADPSFWTMHRELVETLLGFLTTDRWQVHFVDGGIAFTPSAAPVRPAEDYVTLLSGGLDSFVGTIDLVALGKMPFAVSQTVRGDAQNQRYFAGLIGSGLRHLQVNHNAQVPNPESPPSQRARSLIFIAYGVLAATALDQYHAGNTVTLYICENGLISVNPPLTGSRLGSLSTRTTHPVFLRYVQQLLNSAGLRVQIENPYQLKTKGEMLRECSNQDLLRENAFRTTSCGRYKQFGYTHCGRCVPCLIRRAAFLAWGVSDATTYVYADLGRNDESHAGFDDVRAVAMALAEVQSDGLAQWIGTALSAALVDDIGSLQATVGRGLDELSSLFKLHGVT